MPISLRIPPEKELAIRDAVKKSDKTKTAFILEALDEKLGITEDRAQKIRNLAGWLSHEEANELRQSTKTFNRIDDRDWP